MEDTIWQQGLIQLFQIDLFFLISKDGFILNIDKTNGEVVWSKKNFKSEDLNKKKIGDVFSLFLLSDQIFFFQPKKDIFFFVNYKNGEI